MIKQSFSKNERKGIQDGGKTFNAVWFRYCGTEEKTESRAGGSRG